MSFVPSSSRVPAPRHLQGTRPGLLDSTQPERLLRIPGSTLTFAVFDPLAAAGNTTQSRKRKDADPARPKRIVVETPPGGRGQSRWRFVPRARRAPGVEDEGVWPRRVIICGEPCIMSEEQWDIYKLDPEYDCFVRQFPGDPVITRKDHSARPPPPRSAYENYSTGDIRKHSSSPEPDGDRSQNIHKRFRKVVNLVTDEEGTELESETESDDADEVEEIIADEFEPGRPKQTRPTGAGARRKAQEARRKEQREKLKANMPSWSSFESRSSKTPEIVDLTMEDDSPPVEPSSNGAPPPGPTKRKVLVDPHEPSHTNGDGRPDKRARMEPPPEVQRKRTDRQRRKAAQMQERASTLKEQRERRLWEEIVENTPRGTPHGSQSSDSTSSSLRFGRRALPKDSIGVNGEPLGETQESGETGMDTGAVDDEEAARLAAIEESRRKLAELEKDRPLWEEEARRRAARERAEEEARRARKEEERRRAAAAAAEEQRQRQRAAAAAADAESRARAEKERIEREREQRRQRERQRWSYGPWTTVRAIERYRVLSEAFDAAKFTPEDPVMFETIPWPVLHSPVTLRVEDIEWSAVEDFFAAARRHMRSQDYKAFVEKSHKRFHPDRWRARGVLKSVADEELRGCLEVAANTVAQALTPIWREVRG
ncbi:hypothetical protein BV20DRAFT_988191 [Pilatotrama ljubarskyi]|nr:hypothetical protein BV20DRAFT_988191 [Pilatotrama ljubarskyi]